MVFKTDIFSLDKPKKITFNLVGAKLQVQMICIFEQSKRN